MDRQAGAFSRTPPTESKKARYSESTNNGALLRQGSYIRIKVAVQFTKKNTFNDEID